MQREARLAAARRQSAERNLHLRDVLRSVSEGICLFDGDLRLITVNQRFRELFRLPSDKVRRGTAFNWLLERQASISGIRAPDEEIYRSQMVDMVQRRARGQVKVELESGAILRVALTPLSDGRLVITATDVTDEENGGGAVGAAPCRRSARRARPRAISWPA